MDVFSMFATLGLNASGYFTELDLAQRAQDEARRSMERFGQGTDVLEDKIRVLQAQYDAAEQEVKDLTQAFQDSVRETGAASEQSQELADALKNAENRANAAQGELTDMQGALGALTGAEETGNVLTESLIGAFQGLVDVLGKAVIAFFSVKQAMAFMKDAVGTAMSFEQSMSNVVATMGYSVEQLDDKTSEAAQTYQKLSDFAQKMGATTRFTASEAAQALNYMALAGYDAEKSMAMLPNVLNLAASGGMGLAEASDMVTDAASALGLDMQGTTDLVNEMARAASRSNTSVAQLGDAILTVGGTAKMMRGGTVEIAQVLGLLADNGIKASEGGTALRNMLLSLSSPTGEAEKYIQQLGVQVYDAEGNMRSLQDIFLDLKESMSGMTQKEQTDIISTLFNKRDLKSANALLGTSAERWAQLAEEIGNASGAASEMADVQMHNLQGSMTIFQSAMDGFKIAVGEGFLPILTEFVNFGAEAMGALTEGFKAEGVAGLLDAAGKAVADFAIQFTKPDKMAALARAGLDIVVGLVDGIIKAVPAILDAVPTVVGNLIAGLMAAGAEIPRAGYKLLVALIEDLPNVIRSIQASIPDLIFGIIAGFLNGVASVSEAGFELFTSLIDDLPHIIETIVKAIPEIISGFTKNVGEHLDDVAAAGIRIGVAIAEGLVKAIPAIIEAIPKVIAGIAKGIDESMHLLFAKGEDAGETIEAGMDEKIEEDSDDIGERIVTAVSDGVEESSGAVEKIGENIAWKIGGGIRKAGKSIATAVNDTLLDVGRKALAFDSAIKGATVTASAFGAGGYAIPVELTGSALDDAARAVKDAAETTDDATEKVASLMNYGRSADGTYFSGTTTGLSLEQFVSTISGAFKKEIQRGVLSEANFKSIQNGIRNFLKENSDATTLEIARFVNETTSAFDSTKEEMKKLGISINGAVQALEDLPSIDEVIKRMNEEAEKVIKGEVGVMAGFDKSAYKNENGVDYETFAREWAAESGQDYRAVLTLAPQLAEAMWEQVKDAEADAQSTDEVIKQTADNFLKEIPEAMKTALQGVGVYLDNRKVGNLVSSYQRNYSVAMG